MWQSRSRAPLASAAEGFCLRCKKPWAGLSNEWDSSRDAGPAPMSQRRRACTPLFAGRKACGQSIASRRAGRSILRTP
jgi:hypothetical protein